MTKLNRDHDDEYWPELLDPPPVVTFYRDSGYREWAVWTDDQPGESQSGTGKSLQAKTQDGLVSWYFELQSYDWRTGKFGIPKSRRISRESAREILITWGLSEPPLPETSDQAPGVPF